MSGMPGIPSASPSPAVSPTVVPGLVSSATTSAVAPAVDSSLLSIIEYMKKNPVDNADVYALLDRTDRVALSKLLADIDAVDALKYDRAIHVGKTSRQFETEKSGKKGKIFEEIAKNFLSGVACFEVSPNIVTSTNQLDVLVTLGPWSNAVPIFQKWGTHFVCECKFHDKGVSIEWIQKLESLLGTHGANVGLLVSKKPPSKTSRGNIPHALQLYAMKGVYIICISRNDLDKIAAGEGLISIIVKRYLAVQMGVANIMAPSI